MRTLLLLTTLVTSSAFPQALLKEARGYVAVERWAEARDCLLRLPKTIRRRPEVLGLLTEAAYETGHTDELLDFAGRLVKATPEEPMAHVWLARGLLLRAYEKPGEDRPPYFEEALAAARRAARTEDAQLTLVTRDLVVRSLAGLGRIQEAREDVERALAAAPGDVGTHLVLALALEMEGRPGDAVAVLRKAERADPDDARAPAARGEVHLRLQQRQEAIEAFRMALACKTLDQTSRRIAAEQVWNLFATHREFDDARGLLTHWLDAHPKDALGWWWRGYVEELAGEKKVAEKHFRKAWELSERKLGLAALHLGHAHARRREIETAAKFMREAIKLGARARAGTQSAEDAIITLGGLYVAQRDFKAAANAMETYGAPFAPLNHSLNQNTGFFLREYGSLLFRNKKRAAAKRVWKRAGKYYERAARVVVDTDAPARTKAQILNDTGLMFHYHLGNLRRGIDYYERALTYQPDYLDALENMGDAHLKLRRFTEAVTWFDRVLALAPNRKVAAQGKALAERLLREKGKR